MGSRPTTGARSFTAQESYVLKIFETLQQRILMNEYNMNVRRGLVFEYVETNVIWAVIKRGGITLSTETGNREGN